MQACRNQFPILNQTAFGHPLVYLDNAATNQVPQSVIDAMTDHLQTENANIHRGAHYLSERATTHYEDARETVAHFINAPTSNCVVFTSGTTAGLNMIALGLESQLGPGDAIITSQLEHHSNYLPWQQLCFRTGAELRVAPLDSQADLDIKAYRNLLADGRVKIVALAHTSNVVGTVNPVQALFHYAHEAGALTVLDAAQAMRGKTVDVAALNCDYCCFSAHKMVGPAGIGVMYGTEDALDKLEPKVFGGGMVDEVTSCSTEFSALPARFEAGTPNAIGAAGLKAAIEALESFGFDWILQQENDLISYTEESLKTIESVTILGNPKIRQGAISFTVQDRHPYDLASIMDKQGVAIRVGLHCAIPQLEYFGIEASLRISPAFYNTHVEIDKAIASLTDAINFFERWI